MTDNTLTIALFDLESLWAPDPVDWTDYDSFGFALGVVKWVRYQRNAKTGEVHRWVLQENLHFSAAAFQGWI